MSGCDTALTRIFRLAVGSALLLMGTGHAWAQAPAGGPSEGIAVHGHWTIEVRNPDGTVAERREFENALTQQGATLLSAIMARQRAPGTWAIGIVGPCAGGTCYILPAGAGNQAGFFYTLQISGADSVALNGQFAAEQNGNITNVGTWLQSCVATVAFDVCPQPLLPIMILGGTVNAGLMVAGGGIIALPAFTTTAVAPIAVTAGQIVQVSVTISFS